MVSSVAFLGCAFMALVMGDDVVRKPMYKYRYETEDVMKTAESSVPLRGYHVVEGGYYPESNFGRGGGSSGGGFSGGLERIGGYRGFSGGSSGFNPSFISGQRFIGGNSRFYPSSLSRGFQSGNGGGFASQSASGNGGIGGYLPHHHGYLDKNSYNGEKKQLNGEVYEKVDEKKGEEQKHDEEGYKHGKVALKKDHTDKGYYSDEEGDKKHVKDGKEYRQDQQFKQEGKNENEKKLKKGHKKGHVTKGFRTTHHKDESGKTETFFDEENDEGDNYSYDGKSGNFGENSQAAIKGEHENGKFNSGQSKKEGHYDNEHVIDKGNVDKGEYGQKKYSSGGEIYGINKGIDQHSLLGQQEANRIYKHYPYQHSGHAPFYTHY